MSELDQLRYQNEALVKLYDEVKNLINVKGRHNSEVAYRRLVAAFDAINEEPGAPVERQAPEWMPIETAPKDGTRIMLGRAESEDVSAVSTIGWWQEAIEDGVDYMGNDAGFVDIDFQEFYPSRSFGNPSHRYPAKQPTHWQPIAAAPSAQGRTE